ncbi:MAG: glutathione-dependent disulfide-bond oxidoreductase [Novosphingobium sp.]
MSKKDAKKSGEYKVPKVWKWKQSKKNPFGGMNRPISGATHESKLPRGKHPFQLYSLGSPNGQKVTIMFEELLAAGHQGAEYDAWLINIMDRDQFGSGFVAINPNSKIPALLDRSGKKPFRVFESGAILLHLAEKFDAFLPEPGTAARAECYSWLMWQMATAPWLGGGFGHFYGYYKEKLEYPINRFAMEAKRILDVADKHLEKHRYFCGKTYCLADIANYPWLNYFMTGNAYGGSKFLDTASYTHLARWVEEVGQRKGVQRGQIVNRGGTWGGVAERHSAADIDAALGKG